MLQKNPEIIQDNTKYKNFYQRFSLHLINIIITNNISSCWEDSALARVASWYNEWKDGVIEAWMEGWVDTCTSVRGT